jgi:hypothetical protein
MFVRYSDNTKEIELAGNKHDLLSLAHKLSENNVKISLDYEGLDPSPYSRFLSEVRIEISLDAFVEIFVNINNKSQRICSSV